LTQYNGQEIGILMDEKIVAIWFLATIPGHQDWMAGLREIVPDEKYELTYRFRYYEDDKIFESKDKKNWYEGEVSGTRSYCIAAVRSVGQMMAKVTAGGQKLYELVNEGDLAEFGRRFRDMPFAFARMESKTSFDGVGTPEEDKAIADHFKPAAPKPWEVK